MSNTEAVSPTNEWKDENWKNEIKEDAKPVGNLRSFGDRLIVTLAESNKLRPYVCPLYIYACVCVYVLTSQTILWRSISEITKRKTLEVTPLRKHCRV